MEAERDVQSEKEGEVEEKSPERGAEIKGLLKKLPKKRGGRFGISFYS